MKQNKIIIASFLALLSQTACIPVAVVGGAGLVGYNASKERTLGTSVDDTAIEVAVSAKLISATNHKQFDGVSVKSVDRRVLLTGHVITREVKLEAYNIAMNTKGVEEVINEITVDGTTKYNIGDVANDAWISTQVKSRLLFSKEVSGVNYNNETINGTVYLMGIAQSQAELNAATRIASEVKGVQKVVSYVKVKGETVKPTKVNNENRDTAPAETKKQTAPAKAEEVIMEESPNAQ